MTNHSLIAPVSSPKVPEMKLVGEKIWAGVCEIENHFEMGFFPSNSLVLMKGVGQRWIQFYSPRAQTLQLGSDPW